MLVDALQFYVSCERAFQVSLLQHPTAVVGNNDGILVAVSPEARALGLQRGQPLFQQERLIYQHQVRVFSSNYSLYDIMSKRLMAILAKFAPQVEEFSVDEAFCELTDQPIEDLTAFGKTLQRRVQQWLGIPVRVSFASTKVLAKIGGVLLKAEKRYEDVLDLTSWSEQQLASALARIPVEQVFGIGSKYAQLLHNYGIDHARSLRDADERWIKRRLTIVGARIQQELKGISCFPLQPRRKPKQQIVYAKTFGRPITTLDELKEAVCEYTARAAARLRGQESLARRITVFVTTNPFDPVHSAYVNDFTIDLPYSTAFTPTLFTHAQHGARAIYRKGLSFKKAGVVLSHISPLPIVQLDLFGERSLRHYYQEMRFMALVDALQAVYGRDAVKFAAQGIKQPWRMRQERLSQRYMTRWNEILTI